MDGNAGMVGSAAQIYGLLFVMDQRNERVRPPNTQSHADGGSSQKVERTPYLKIGRARAGMAIGQVRASEVNFKVRRIIQREAPEVVTI